MTPLSTKDVPLSQAQKQWYEAACKKIDLGRLKQLIFDLTAKHSPTGAEREACIADLENSIKEVNYTVIDSCTRTRTEVGLTE